MELILAMIGLAVLFGAAMGNRGSQIVRQNAIEDKERWRKMVTNPELESQLVDFIRDSANLEALHQEVDEAFYAAIAGKDLSRMDGDAAGYCQRNHIPYSAEEVWKQQRSKMTPFLRVLLAKRGYISKMDAAMSNPFWRRSSLTCVNNPITACLIFRSYADIEMAKWCSEELKKHHCPAVLVGSDPVLDGPTTGVIWDRKYHWVAPDGWERYRF